MPNFSPLTIDLTASSYYKYLQRGKIVLNLISIESCMFVINVNSCHIKRFYYNFLEQCFSAQFYYRRIKLNLRKKLVLNKIFFQNIFCSYLNYIAKKNCSRISLCRSQRDILIRLSIGSTAFRLCTMYEYCINATRNFPGTSSD